MSEPRDPRSVVDAAEQAAAAGDHASAERLLREAALLQEASLGPLHPDLANTLNNLGVVCEITDKPEDAERYFRRAYTIATAVLEPDHPFVATSRRNLEEFCAARGKTIDSPAETPITNLSAAATDSGLPLGRLSIEDSRTETPVTPPRSSRGLAIGALLAVGLILAFLVVTWFRSNGGSEPSPGDPGVSAESASTTAPALVRSSAPEASEPIPATRSDSPVTQPRIDVTSPAPPAGGRAAGSSAPAATESTPRAASTSPPPLVASAQLCRELVTGGAPGASGDWQCQAPGNPVDAGRLFFYTRIKSSTDTTVQHRWFRGDRLRQSVELPVRANPSSGYRTYSRNTVSGESSGDWRVELRAADGTLLHEERFVVR